MKTCAKVGCNLPVFVEPRTLIEHKYCGRTHALEYERGTLQAPHGDCQRCNLPGCYKTVAFDSTTGRVHDFCSMEHANQAIQLGLWPTPTRQASTGTGNNKKISKTVTTDRNRAICRFPSCQLPVYHDAMTGRNHDYCGRTHAVEHRLMQQRVDIGHNSTSNAKGANRQMQLTSIRTENRRYADSGRSSSTDATAVAGNNNSTKITKLSPTKLYILRFDGGSRGNPGICGAGMVLYEESKVWAEVWSGCVFLDGNKGTNNEAEYQALIHGLKCATALGVKRIVAQGDSELVVKQMLGIYRCTSPNLYPLFQEATSLAQQFDSFDIESISREQNVRADELANLAMSTRKSIGVDILLEDDKKPAAIAECVVCLASKAVIKLIPCGHVSLCQEDANRMVSMNQLLLCPLCRQPVTGTEKVA